MFKHAWTLAAAALLTLCLGCPSKSDQSNDQSGSTAAGKTPEETFKTLQTASKAENHKALFECMDPQARDQILLGMTMSTGFVKRGKDEETTKKIDKQISGLLEAHKVEQLDTPPDPRDPKARDEAANKMFGKVEDKGALFADLTSFFKEHTDNPADTTYAEGTLEDLKIEGETASATIAHPDGKSSTIHFVKRDGRWYLSTGQPA